MNTYKDMGIQQWRLKNSYAQTRFGESDVVKQELSQDVKQDLGKADAESKQESEIVENLSVPVTDNSDASQIDQNDLQPLAKPVDTGAQHILEEASVVDEQSLNHGSALDQLDWQGLQAMIDTNKHCPSCGLGNTLLGSGNANAQWMFVVDAPTSREVSEQTMCVGRAGELFDAMLGALGLNRAEVYLSSVFKCAPTADLSATPQCNDVLHRQIELVAPTVIITFGEFAGQAVIKANDSLEVLRASSQHCVRTSVAVVPTYSPVQMLSNLSLKALVWEDLKKAMAIVDR